MGQDPLHNINTFLLRKKTYKQVLQYFDGVDGGLCCGKHVAFDNLFPLEVP